MARSRPVAISIAFSRNHGAPGINTLVACEKAIRAARFRTLELVATLPGVAFYHAFGYKTGERYEVPLVNGLSLPVVKMTKTLATSHE